MLNSLSWMFVYVLSAIDVLKYFFVYFKLTFLKYAVNYFRMILIGFSVIFEASCRYVFGQLCLLCE